jgi:hypothetical protein
MNKKAAIQLSAGFLVILLLSLVVFGIGLTLMTKIFVGAEDIKKNLDAKTATQIRHSLKGSNIVSLPFNRLTVARKKHDIAGVGILNKLGDTSTFSVHVTCNAALSHDDVVFCDESSGIDCASVACDGWVLSDTDGISLENNEDVVSDVLVAIPSDAETGKYVFNVEVQCTGGPVCDDAYGSVKKLYVTVP